jgi:DNA-binding MarR family transcriptional regulator
VPSARLVRVALARMGELNRGVVRAGMVVVETLAEQGRAAADSERFWWERPVKTSVTSLAAEAGLLVSETEAALAALVETDALSGDVELGWRISPDVLCEEPALAAMDWPAIRERLGRSRARLAPATMVLRELVRLASAADSEAPVAARIGELAESSLFGRSAVTHALADLETAGLVERLATSTRQGVRVRIESIVWGREADRRSLANESTAAQPELPAADEYVEEISFGQHRVEVPADATLRITTRPDGGSRVELGPLVIESSPDGTQVATCGGLRITRRPRL